MLILTRKIGESLMIGYGISVTVVGLNGNQVRLGINAPKDVAVHREEVYDRIKIEKMPQSEQHRLRREVAAEGSPRGELESRL